MGEVELTDDSVYKLSDIRAQASLVTGHVPREGNSTGNSLAY